MNVKWGGRWRCGPCECARKKQYKYEPIRDETITPRIMRLLGEDLLPVEIAERLGLSRDVVYQRISRWRKNERRKSEQISESSGSSAGAAERKAHAQHSTTSQMPEMQGPYGPRKT